jgi:hypothetical protein
MGVRFWALSSYFELCMSIEMECMWAEVVVAWFKALSKYLLGDRESMKIQSSLFTVRDFRAVPSSC